MRAPHIAYRPGLDGLRALAVIAVFLYHSRIDWMPGGFLGVDLFFVLSGYLITSLLLVEWEARNRIDLRRFWLRRARRLFPALVVVVLAALILGAIFARGDLARTRGDAISSLFYYTNWHLVLANHSYFVRMGSPSLLQHLWSLAVEEQFYLIWPLLLVPGLVLVGRKRLPLLIVAGIAGSAALMWLLYKPTDPSRVYYGTDTRAFLLLMGILLALVWPAIERMRRSLPLLELLGVAALVGSVLLFRQMQDFNPTLYRGGDVAAAFCFAVLIAAVAHPMTGLGRALGVAPLRWLGERSYGIYLWHWLVIALMRPGVDISWTGPGVVVAQAAIVLSAATLSFRYVEQPIRTGSLQRRLAEHPRRLRLELVGGGTIGLVASFAILFVIPKALNPVSGYVNPQPVRAAVKPSHRQPVADKQKKLSPLPPGRILALGDSVMLDCKRQLRGALLHRVRIDATVGRQIDGTIKDLDRLRRHHRLPKTIVLQVGNNGPLWFHDLVNLRHALRGVPEVVVVNVRNTTSWQDESNQALVDWLRGWPAAHLADWYGSSTNKMLSDGTHPWPYGCTIYARMISKTLRSA
ncbi:MAG TPA: acyltransferase family protein [Gaiellaceae bacterium]|jgi:peptidoglycan/LPS O-acetylase OafA/YrhL|nr:acyltransferase family protein [Gaiellaceae bacterium]